MIDVDVHPRHWPIKQLTCHRWGSADKNLTKQKTSVIALNVLLVNLVTVDVSASQTCSALASWRLSIVLGTEQFVPGVVYTSCVHQSNAFCIQPSAAGSFEVSASQTCSALPSWWLSIVLWTEQSVPGVVYTSQTPPVFSRLRLGPTMCRHLKTVSTRIMATVHCAVDWTGCPWSCVQNLRTLVKRRLYSAFCGWVLRCAHPLCCGWNHSCWRAAILAVSSFAGGWIYTIYRPYISRVYSMYTYNDINT